MIKHYVNYIDGIYYIEEDETIVMSIELDKKTGQIIIRTPSGSYTGGVRELKVEKKLD